MTRVTPPSPAAVQNLGVASEPHRAAQGQEDAQRSAVLHRGTRFGYGQNRPKPSPASSQTRKRRMPLPRGRKKNVGDEQDDEQGHASTQDDAHRTVQKRGMGDGDSGGDSGGESGGHSHGGGDRHSGGEHARVPAIRTTGKSPVPPRSDRAWLSATATQMDIGGPEYAEAARHAFCRRLLALRAEPGARSAGIAELQLDFLEAKKACPLLREPEAMAALIQRLIDANEGQIREKNPFNALVPLVALMSERPLTPRRAQHAANVLTLQRNTALAA